MSLIIPDEFLQTAHISEADLKLEIAILFFQQKKDYPGYSQPICRHDSTRISTDFGRPQSSNSLRCREIPTKIENAGRERLRAKTSTANPG